MSENVNPRTLKEEKLYRIPTNYLKHFLINTIHGGCFRTLHSLGNFRVQLVSISSLATQKYYLRQRSLELEYSKISDSYLNRYKVNFEEYISPSVSHNNINYNTVQSNTFRSILSLKNKNFNLQIPKCTNIFSLKVLLFLPDQLSL